MLPYSRSRRRTQINDISNKLDLQLYKNFQIHAELSHEIADLDNELRQRDFLIFQLTRSLAASQKKNSSLIIQLHLACQQSTNNYALVRNERRKTTRSTNIAKAAQALAHLRELDHLVAEEKLLRLEQENDHLQTSIMAVEGEKTVVVEITKLQSKGEALRKKTRTLQMRSLRASTMTANAVSRAKTKVAVFKITSGGKYTPQVCALSRKLVKYGCSQEFVGAIIEDVCRAAGVHVNGRISRRMVARAIGEGGVAAKIQILDEISRASSTLHVVISPVFELNFQF
jgi:hypothetical protein